ncbi:hypothetical protein [Terricaulis sp.]|uniref:hypothetical protein n=1 Tax=Terricaulis sp. TaxID=2768686 RepID=UPI003784F3BE
MGQTALRDVTSDSSTTAEAEIAVGVAAAQSQLAMLSGLLRTLMTLVRVRMQRSRLMQLSGEIEALARRNGWRSAADLAHSLGFFFAQVDCAQACDKTPETIVAAIEAAALHPERDWMPVITAVRVAVGAAADRLHREA